MRVHELIEFLEDFDGDQEVVIATQPSYPLAFRAVNICHDVDNDRVYIAASECNLDGSSYAPRGVWEQSEIYGDEEDC